MNEFSTISRQLTNQKSTSFFKAVIQPKLTIHRPNDIYEQEADTVAEKVMRMPDSKAEPLFFQPKPLSLTPVQRKCAACENEEKIQRKEDEEEEPVQLKPIKDYSVQRKCSDCEEEEEKVQMKGETIAIGGMTAPSSVNNVINSGGHPLDRRTRNFMESRFGYDFGNVQIHNDSLAHRSSSEINALAYANGNHIVFASGNYQPHTNSGKQLLAHELTHVIQQRSQNIIQRDKDDQNETDPMTEIERQLNRLFDDPDDPRLAERRKLLNSLFASLDSDTGGKLYKRLAKPARGDNLAKSFNRLATHTRRELIGILHIHFEAEEYLKAMESTNFCKPFTREEIDGSVDFTATNEMDHFINGDFRDLYGDETANILDEYQQRKKGDPLTPKIFDKPSGQIVDAFINDPVTEKTQQELINQLEKFLLQHCPNLPENQWTSFDLKDFLPASELNKSISFNATHTYIIPTIPSVLAGGVSGSDAGMDSRGISGKFELLRSANNTKLSIRTGFHFVIKDAFDFCPGNKGGRIAQIFTIPLSRMEASDLAYDAPFEVYYNGPQIQKDLNPEIIKKCFST